MTADKIMVVCAVLLTTEFTVISAWLFVKWWRNPGDW